MSDDAKFILGIRLEGSCLAIGRRIMGDRREAVNFLRDGYAVSHAFALAIADRCLRADDTDDFDGGRWADDEEEGDRW